MILLLCVRANLKILQIWSSSMIIALTANCLVPPRAWWRAAKSITSHDKAGGTHALEDGHSIYLTILSRKYSSHLCREFFRTVLKQSLLHLDSFFWIIIQKSHWKETHTEHYQIYSQYNIFILTYCKCAIYQKYALKWMYLTALVENVICFLSYIMYLFICAP